MNEFIADLLDHKERVAKYMAIAHNILCGYLIMPMLVEADIQKTLMGAVILASRYQQLGAAPFDSIRPSGQLAVVASNTMAYFSNKGAYSSGWLQYAISDLFQRACVHDNSKFSNEEFDLYDQAFPELQKWGYGTPEYKAAVKLLGPALDHHLKVNDHHPEYFDAGLVAMHAVQQIEMCCDWCAASDRSQTPIKEGLEKNRARFWIDDNLYPTIKNTVLMLKERASD